MLETFLTSGMIVFGILLGAGLASWLLTRKGDQHDR